MSKTNPNPSIETLLELAASTSSVLPWGVAILSSIERIFLWDTRPDASLAILEAIADEEGSVDASGVFTHSFGPVFEISSSSVIGALITAPVDSPSLDDLEMIAGQLRFRYLMATRPEQTDESEPF